MEFCIVVTTVDTDEGARKIAEKALESRLAACVQIFPIRSHYVWEGEVREETEFYVQLKARADDYSRIAEAIRSIHPYEIPEILRIEIAEGDTAYLDWIERSTMRP